MNVLDKSCSVFHKLLEYHVVFAISQSLRIRQLKRLSVTEFQMLRNFTNFLFFHGGQFSAIFMIILTMRSNFFYSVTIKNVVFYKSIISFSSSFRNFIENFTDYFDKNERLKNEK